MQCKLSKVPWIPLKKHRRLFVWIMAMSCHSSLLVISAATKGKLLKTISWYHHILCFSIIKPSYCLYQSLNITYSFTFYTFSSLYPMPFCIYTLFISLFMPSYCHNYYKNKRNENGIFLFFSTLWYLWTALYLDFNTFQYMNRHHISIKLQFTIRYYIQFYQTTTSKDDNRIWCLIIIVFLFINYQYTTI